MQSAAKYLARPFELSSFRMKNLAVSALMSLGVASCSLPTKPRSNLETHEGQSTSHKSQSKSTSLPRTYWPLDYKVQKSDTLLPGQQAYHITVATTCLNDSAVINPITLDAGPALDVSHNYISDIYIARGKQPWQHERLTKTFFQDNSIMQKFGPLHELQLSRTAFLRYQHGEFCFYTRLGIPDSDIFMEAEVALTPTKGLRVISVKPQEFDE